MLLVDFEGEEPEEELESCDDWERRDGRDRSVEDEENVWLSQPESLVGRSPMRDAAVDDEWPMSEMARSERVRGRGKGGTLLTGSMITGGSSISSSSLSTRPFLPTDVLLPLAIGSVIDRPLSRWLLPFCRNFASFDVPPVVVVVVVGVVDGLGDDAEGGIRLFGVRLLELLLDIRW